MINLFLDDIRNPNEVYKDGSIWLCVRDVFTAKTWLQKGIVQDLSLDHDLGQDKDGSNVPNGHDLICWMEEHGRWPRGKIYVHSKNIVGAQRMVQAITRHYERMERKNVTRR